MNLNLVVKAVVFWLSGILVVLGLTCVNNITFTIVALVLGGFGIYRIYKSTSIEDIKIFTGISWFEKKTGVDLTTED